MVSPLGSTGSTAISNAIQSSNRGFPVNMITKGLYASTRALLCLGLNLYDVQLLNQNGIQPVDIYNFDETDFAMGVISAVKVVTRAEYYERRSIKQPGNRE